MFANTGNLSKNRGRFNENGNKSHENLLNLLYNMKIFRQKIILKSMWISSAIFISVCIKITTFRNTIRQIGTNV
jgi:hypothetical protein